MDLYKYTCPEIDASLKHLNRSMEWIDNSIQLDINKISKFIEYEIAEIDDGTIDTDLSDNIRSKVTECIENIHTYFKEFYEDEVKGEIEEVRDTNSKLRDSADSIIAELKRDIESLEDQVKELGGEV